MTVVGRRPYSDLLLMAGQPRRSKICSILPSLHKSLQNRQLPYLVTRDRLQITGDRTVTANLSACRCQAIGVSKLNFASCYDGPWIQISYTLHAWQTNSFCNPE